MRRRRFLTSGALAVSSAGLASRWLVERDSEVYSPLGPIRSLEPVVGDGTWIWREPPATSRGYLEPRSFELSIGIEMTGASDRSEAIASTPVPVEHPEQKIDEVSIEKVGCEATIRELAPGAGQLLMRAPNLLQGQTAKAIVHYKLTLSKQYFGYERDQFSVRQDIPRDIQLSGLGDSPGIQTKAGSVKKLASDLTSGLEHPWDKAEIFMNWVQNNIRPVYGPYTSVTAAIEKKVGDCEEMSAVFVALCRCVGIPARLVWVPNHNWAEVYFLDQESMGHWIPVHPACYRWFGWTGVHELVIQKGDRIRVPETNSQVRLLLDWVRSNGRRPLTNYLAELKPIAINSNGDPGPGQRSKDQRSGEWKLTGNHPQDRFARR